MTLARLFVEAGGPAGVFNVVNGLGPEAGKALALHPDVPSSPSPAPPRSASCCWATPGSRT
jgi:hypothetical protein